ncbi:uncharacterized protein LOC126693913 isoform X1 [Quercus robur]|uniref:uncharacterized protein LOC126693913 isoform X1 n=1 Tax=Quercus robur TaxID=38942 RepID=UPI0021631B5E|nr:uncharacterized protein LOC126693913 isoform X1 [Quercus robur]
MPSLAVPDQPSPTPSVAVQPKSAHAIAVLDQPSPRRPSPHLPHSSHSSSSPSLITVAVRRRRKLSSHSSSSPRRRRPSPAQSVAVPADPLQELVVWIMWSLYWKFCVLEIFCYFVKVDSVHSVLEIFCLQKLVVWIMWALN